MKKKIFKNQKHDSTNNIFLKYYLLLKNVQVVLFFESCG